MIACVSRSIRTNWRGFASLRLRAGRFALLWLGSISLASCDCLLPTAYCRLPPAACRLPLAKAQCRHWGLGQRFPFASVFSGYPVLVSSSIHPIVIKAV